MQRWPKARRTSAAADRHKTCLSIYSKNKRPPAQLRRPALAIEMNTGRAMGLAETVANAPRSINGKRSARFYQRGERPFKSKVLSRESKVGVGWGKTEPGVFIINDKPDNDR
jgi:hypothetical protein